MRAATRCGRFELVERIGAGGMGEIWRAREHGSGVPVAVKVLSHADVGHAQRLLRECELLSRVEHPAIVKFIDAGVDANGSAYLAMAWLEGEDLAKRLTRGPLGVDEALSLARRMCEALAAAHERGVVHRDIKPSNVFLVGGDPAAACLIDFGIAKSLLVTPRALTGTGAMVGTVGYMSPEQVRGEKAIDARTDLFSLGCVLFEAIAGRAAYEAAHVVAILARILLEEPPRLKVHANHVPPGVDELVGALMSKARGDRPRDATAVLARLDDLDLSPPRTSVPEAALSPDEQRYVSVLVAANMSDPVDALAPTHDARDTFIASRVTRLRSTFLRLASDVCLAVFDTRSLGIEDGSMAEVAARAARTALEIRQADPSVAVAMSTGLVRQEADAPVGAAVDRAVALLDGLRPGDVVVDDTSAKLIEAAFELTHASGRYRLERERQGRERRPLGRASELVGRKRELAFLVAAYDECCEETLAQAVLLVGEPGLGKSRLVTELRHRLANVQWVVARGDPVHAESTFGLVSRTIADTLGLGATRTSASLREALTRRAAADELAVMAPFVGELVGTSDADETNPALVAARADPKYMAHQLRRAMSAFFRLFDSAPLVLWIDDAQWSDAPSLSVIEEVVRARAQPTLVLVSARPTIDARFPRLFDVTGVRRLPMEPLSPPAAARLVRSLDPALEPEQVGRVVATAAGNAFFLEELVGHVQQTRSGELPDSVLGMAHARLSALGPSARRVLRAASVFGQSFRHEGVHALLGADDAASLRKTIDEMLVVGVLERREPQLAFRHGLLREAAYASLTPSDRILGHRLAAEWLSRASQKERSKDDLGSIAVHLDRASSPMAPAAYLDVARVEIARHELADADAHLARGLELATEPSDLLALHLARGGVRVVRGESNAALASYESARPVASTDDARYRVEVGVASALRNINRYDDALAAIARAEQAAIRASMSCAQAQYLRGAVEFALGHLEASRVAHERALALATESGAIELRVQALGGLADAHYGAGRLVSAARALEVCISAARKNGLLAVEAANVALLATMSVFLNEGARAKRLADEGFELARSLSLTRAEAVSMGAQSLAACTRGDHAEARRVALAALDLSRRLGSVVFEQTAYYYLAQAQIGLGEVGEARESIDRGITLSRAHGTHYLGAALFATRARLEPERTERERLLREGETLLAGGTLSFNRFWFYDNAIETHLADGNAHGARTYAAELAHTEETIPWVECIVVRALALADHIDGRRDLATRERLAVALRVCSEAELRGAASALERALAIW